MDPDPAPHPTPRLSIADVAERTGLSRDTLRWYEKEGLLPAVNRDAAGRRAYDDADVRLVEMVVRLRRTGMPVREAAEFVRLVGEGAASHGRRRALLEAHRTRVLDRLDQVRSDLDALDAKIAHYARLDDRSTP